MMISPFVGIDFVFFIERFQVANEGDKDLGIIFRGIKFNAGSVKSRYFCKGRVGELTDGFGMSSKKAGNAIDNQ